MWLHYRDCGMCREGIEPSTLGLSSGGTTRGREVIQPIAFPPRAITTRPSVSRATAGRIFRRDGFVCRYCGCQTIPTPIMQLVAGVYPDVFSYHPTWKGGATHPAIPARSAVVDQVVPGAHGATGRTRPNWSQRVPSHTRSPGRRRPGGPITILEVAPSGVRRRTPVVRDLSVVTHLRHASRATRAPTEQRPP